MFNSPRNCVRVGWLDGKVRVIQLEILTFAALDLVNANLGLRMEHLNLVCYLLGCFTIMSYHYFYLCLKKLNVILGGRQQLVMYCHLITAHNLSSFKD